MNAWHVLPLSRSTIFENTEWSQAASSTPMPTNQRNRRSYSSRSIKIRSERIEQNACSSIARCSFSGGIEGPPANTAPPSPAPTPPAPHSQSPECGATDDQINTLRARLTRTQAIEQEGLMTSSETPLLPMPSWIASFTTPTASISPVKACENGARQPLPETPKLDLKQTDPNINENPGSDRKTSGFKSQSLAGFIGIRRLSTKNPRRRRCARATGSSDRQSRTTQRHRLCP